MGPNMKAIIIALVILAGGSYANTCIMINMAREENATRYCTLAQVFNTLMFVFLCAALVVQKVCIK